MGNGSFDGQKFSFYASFLFRASATDFQQWRRAIEAASQALFHATNGQMSIGKIVVYNNSTGLPIADLWLTKPAGTSSTAGSIACNTPADHVILRSDEKSHPGVVLHELGHYLFSLHDEYTKSSCTGNAPGTCTVGPPTESACIMQFSGLGDVIDLGSGVITKGTVRSFCCPLNHTDNNNQALYNHQSCWDTIIARWGEEGTFGEFPTIVGPASGTRPSGAPTGSVPDAVEWMEMATHTRIVCLVSEPQPPQLPQVELLTNFIGPLSQIDKEPEVRFLVPGATLASFTDALNTAAQKWQRGLEFSVKALSIENITASLNEVPVSNQRLLFHGRPSQVLRDYVAQSEEQLTKNILRAGFFSNGVTDTNAAQEIVFRTNGHNRWLLRGPGLRNVVSNATQYLASAFDSVENWGLLGEHADTFPNAVQTEPLGVGRYSPADLLRVKQQTIDTQLGPTRLDLPVYVEAGASRVAFAVNMPADAEVWLYLRNPQGDIIDPDSPHVGFTNSQEYQLYTLSPANGQSLQGRWTMHLERAQGSQSTPFSLRAYALNARLLTHLRVNTSVQPNTYQLAASIQFAGLPLNLGPLAARVTEMTPAGEVGSTRLIELVQAPTAVAPNSSHTYTTTLTRQPNNISAIRVAIQNVGQAVQILPQPDPGEPPEIGDAIPRFNRILEATIGR